MKLPFADIISLIAFLLSAIRESSGIAGGQSFVRGDYPWIVALSFVEGLEKPIYFCGGSLISSTFVISGKFFKKVSSIIIKKCV